MRRLLCLILILIFISSFLTGCYDRREVDDLAYAIALGIDKGKTNEMRVTMQIANPRAISGGGGGGGGGAGGGGGKPVLEVTVECPTLFSGINMLNSFVSRKLNLAHAKAIVFSKEFAQSGKMGDLITAIQRDREIRPNIWVLVARGSAMDFIKFAKPSLETNPAKYYELIFEGFAYTGFTAKTDLFKFYRQMTSLTGQPVAVLCDNNKNESVTDFSISDSTASEKGRNIPLEGDFKAGQLPRIRELKAEIMGLAVFDGKKMVGELDGEETSYYLMATGQFNHSFFSMADPLEKSKFVILDVSRSRYPVNKVKMVGGKPSINMKIRLEADIRVIQSGINYEAPENISILESAYENFIKNGMKAFLEKTSKDFHSDICNFGDPVRRNFLTLKQWEDFNWLSRYKDASFNIDLDLKIRRPGLLISTSPVYSSTGKDSVR